MRKYFTKKRVILLAIAALAIGLGTGAFAYFSSTGSGTGSAKVGTSTDWQVDTDTYTGGPMTPGGDSGTYESIAYRVTNNSTGYQNLANVNIKVAESDGSPWSNGSCSKDDFELSVDGGTTWAAAGDPVDDTALAGNIAPGDTTADGSITIRMIDTGVNQDDCKNADVPLYLYAT